MGLTPDRVVLSPDASRQMRVWAQIVFQPHEARVSIQVERWTEWLPLPSLARNNDGGWQAKQPTPCHSKIGNSSIRVEGDIRVRFKSHFPYWKGGKFRKESTYPYQTVKRFLKHADFLRKNASREMMTIYESQSDDDPLMNIADSNLTLPSKVAENKELLYHL